MNGRNTKQKWKLLKTYQITRINFPDIIIMERMCAHIYSHTNDAYEQ